MSEHAEHHINYTRIYFTLLILLVVSVAGPFLGIFWVTLITAFGIALVKANLVIQNFMHLRTERRIMKWVLAASLMLMFLMFFAVAPDVMRHTGTNWENEAAQAATERGIPLEGEHGAAAGEQH
ncbi:MAG: cytochrome C oxidase subunit IV family protein [Gemmatimonadota bacterium]